MAKIRLQPEPFGTYILVKLDGDGNIIDDILIQSDWEFPGLASSFGWQSCHPETDGTIPCPVCKKKPGELIKSAIDWLDEHLYNVIDDPGYFD